MTHPLEWLSNTIRFKGGWDDFSFFLSERIGINITPLYHEMLLAIARAFEPTLPFNKVNLCKAIQNGVKNMLKAHQLEMGAEPQIDMLLDEIDIDFDNEITNQNLASTAFNSINALRLIQGLKPLETIETENEEGAQSFRPPIYPEKREWLKEQGAYALSQAKLYDAIGRSVPGSGYAPAGKLRNLVTYITSLIANNPGTNFTLDINAPVATQVTEATSVSPPPPAPRTQGGGKGGKDGK